MRGIRFACTRSVVCALSLAVILALGVALPAVAGVFAPIASGDGALVLEEKVEPPVPANNQLFGEAVAIDATTAVVGDRYDDTLAVNAGAAYVYVRDDAGDWNLQQQLTASDGDASDAFGMSVAVQGDTIWVGASADEEGGQYAGAAYVFERTGTTWTQKAKFTGGQAQEQMGLDVAIDGDFAIAGSPGTGEPPPGFPDPMVWGHVTVFVKTGGSWVESAAIYAWDDSTWDMFARSVDIAGDRIVAGAPDDSATGSHSGSAYTYQLTAPGWTPTGKLTPGAGVSHAGFGEVVALDDDRCVVGAPGYGDAGPTQGAAFAFERGGGGWTELARLQPNTSVWSDVYGRALDLDGDRLIVGCSDIEGFMGLGAAHVYSWTGSSPEIVSVNAAPDGARHSFSMMAVAITDDYAICGSPYDQGGGLPSYGSAYIFALDGFRTAKDTPFTLAAPGVLGNDTELDGDPMTASLETSPSHGSVSLAADGSFTYTPAAGWTGTDAFTYRAAEGTGTSLPATVTIVVESPPHDHSDAPPACTACHTSDLSDEHTIRLAYTCETCHASVDPDVSAAISAGDPDCTDCHGIATGKHDFSAPAVSYNRCRKCHWYPAHYTSRCADCHPQAPTDAPAYAGRVFTASGYFSSPRSLDATAGEIHEIHVEGSWFAGRFTPLGCDSCHAAAKCQACHGKVVHGKHTRDSGTGTYGAAPVNETVARGTWRWGTDTSRQFGTTCVAAGCHERSAVGTEDFASPDCRGCHP